MAGRGNGWRPWGLGLVIGLVWLLGGCFQSDLILQFDHHHHGHWTQTLTLGERNLAFAHDALDPWLQQIHDPVQDLGGRLRQTPSTIELTVPFSTPADLAERFNTVFTAPSLGATNSLGIKDGGNPWGDAPATVLTLPGVGSVPFHLETQEQNWGLFSQVRLVYDLDLRSIGELGESVWGEVSREDGVSFQLQVPWGVASLAAAALSPDQIDPAGARWILPLGEISHIEARFWLPNWIGLGGLVLAVIVLLGYVVRYRWLGSPR